MDAGISREGDLAQGGEDLRGGMGNRFLLQSAQRRLPRRRVGFQEAVEEGLALDLQQWRQAAKGLVVGLLAGRCDETLQACHARADDLFAVEFLACQLQQQGGLVMFEGALEQPGLQAVKIEGCGAAKAQVSLHKAFMIRLRSVPSGVGEQAARVDRELLGHERNHLSGKGPKIVRHEAEIAETAQLQCVAKAVVRGSLALDLAPVAIRQQEEGIQVVLRNGAWKALPALQFGVAEKVDGHALVLSRKRPSS